MRKLLAVTLAAMLVAVFVVGPVMAQSTGGVFVPSLDYLVSGQWSFSRSIGSPICFPGVSTGTQWSTCLTPTEPTANGVITLPKGTDTLVGKATTDTLTNKTLTAPTITAPGNSSTGMVLSRVCTLTENGAATSYTCTIPIPAGAVIGDIRVIPRVLWNGTSASLKVGDTADDDGYFAAVDLKATDLVVGEILSASDESLWGGKNGVYLVSATGRRGPTSSNFGFSYVAGSNITFIVTPGAADGTTGRTDCVVTYFTGSAISQVVV